MSDKKDARNKILSLQSFSLVKKIGEGGFGQVFSAFFDNKMPVAIKSIKLDTEHDDEMVYLGHELRCMRKVMDCQYTVDFYGSFVEKGYIFIILGLCTGGSIYEIIELGPLTEKQIK